MPARFTVPPKSRGSYRIRRHGLAHRKALAVSTGGDGRKARTEFLTGVIAKHGEFVTSSGVRILRPHGAPSRGIFFANCSVRPTPPHPLQAPHTPIGSS